jgi:hypothetical protein
MNPTILILALALTAPAQEAAGRGRDEGAERLEFMKESAQRFDVTRYGGRAALRLRPEPAFRLGDQFTGVLEGAIFFWIDEDSRPEAAVQVFKVRYEGAPLGVWIHSFSSLSPGTFAAVRGGRTVWNPATPGVEFRSVAGAPAPAGSAAQRARQMRALAREFRAEDDFRKDGWQALRLLPTPIARYGRPGSRVRDGALFAFVLGTDPEVFLFLEDRPGDRGEQWQYALAPMTVFAVKASYQGGAIWELPDRKPAKDPARPFFDYVDESIRP